MSFSSPLFVFVLLPIVLVGHSIVPVRLRNPFLLMSSIAYFVLADIPHILPVICLVAINYKFGIILRNLSLPGRQRFYLIIAIILNILVLTYFKYSVFIIENLNIAAGWLGIATISIQNISTPLGLSFIIFQIIAYLIDCYNEVTEPQQNVVRFSLFVLFFAKITAGPIIRHNEVADSLISRNLNLDNFVFGLKRFIIGLSKKVLIADVLAKTVNPVFSLPQYDLIAGVSWLVIVCFSLQLYYDFSGYSDMAIGIGRMLGFTFQENFDSPYCATSLTDFWRRWHISLSTWLKDYLFLPLSYALITERVRKRVASGSFKLKYISAVSILTVFTLCGLWHGAAWTFVIWGVFHGLILAVESLGFSKKIKSWWRPFQHIYTLIIIMIAWVFFRSPTLDYAINFLKSMFFLSTTPSATYIYAMSREAVITLGIALLFVLPLQDVVSAINIRYRGSIQTLQLQSSTKSYIESSLSYISHMTLLLLSFASLSSTTYNPFLYGKF